MANLSAANAARIDRHSAMFKELTVGTAIRTLQTELDTAEASLAAAETDIDDLETITANLANIAFGTETCSAADGDGTVTLTSFGTPTAVAIAVDETTPGPNEAEVTVAPGTDKFDYLVIGRNDGAAEDCSSTNLKFYYIAVR